MKQKSFSFTGLRDNNDPIHLREDPAGNTNINSKDEIEPDPRIDLAHKAELDHGPERQSNYLYPSLQFHHLDFNSKHSPNPCSQKKHVNTETGNTITSPYGYQIHTGGCTRPNNVFFPVGDQNNPDPGSTDINIQLTDITRSDIRIRHGPGVDLRSPESLAKQSYHDKQDYPKGPKDENDFQEDKPDACANGGPPDGPKQNRDVRNDYKAGSGLHKIYDTGTDQSLTAEHDPGLKVDCKYNWGPDLDVDSRTNPQNGTVDDVSLAAEHDPGPKKGQYIDLGLVLQSPNYSCPRICSYDEPSNADDKLADSSYTFDRCLKRSLLNATERKCDVDDDAGPEEQPREYYQSAKVDSEGDASCMNSLKVTLIPS